MTSMEQRRRSARWLNLWLLAAMLVQPTTSITFQKRVGTVFSPTQFGMVHFTHRKAELAEKGNKIIAALDREMERLNRTGNEMRTLYVQDQRGNAVTEIEEIKKKLDEEMLFVGQHRREKRFLAGLVAAASAIFSFGLGISTEVELKSLRSATAGLANVVVASSYSYSSVGRLSYPEVVIYPSFSFRLQ